MSPSVVSHAERQGRHGKTVVIAAPVAAMAQLHSVVIATVMATMATEAIAQLHGRCFPPSVLPVVKTHRCLLNPVEIDQSTVQTVTARQTQETDTSYWRITIGWVEAVQLDSLLPSHFSLGTMFMSHNQDNGAV